LKSIGKLNKIIVVKTIKKIDQKHSK